MPPPTAWLYFPQPNPKASLRLFCFPYAGGGPLLFRSWPAQMPENVEICAVQLPGRGVRLREPVITRMEELVPPMAEALKPFLDKPFAIFGYSLGALIGFELARFLRQTSSVQPLQLFVAGRRAPQLPANRSPRYALPDDEFMSELQRLGGTPKEVFDHPELAELIMPMVRADFELDETYVCRSEPPLDVPMSAYGGLDDADVSREQLESWREQTTASFELTMFPGDHFFLHTAPSGLFQAVKQRLATAQTKS